jgi:hypothetical protein
MTITAVQNKYERMIQIYNWYRTARLNVLYYEESLKQWGWTVRIHDVLIALSGAGSPIAFWQRSPEPLLHQAWFYLTLFAAGSATLKPVLRWENKLTQFTELHTQYCDLYMDLKCLVEDVTAARDLNDEYNSVFEHCRTKFKELGKKEPLEDKRKIKRLEQQVIREIDINDCWLPPEE